MAFNVILYRDDDGSIPAIDWFRQLDARVLDKVFARIRRLKTFGFELRRPVADYLRDGIYELRTVHMRVQYRMLYFFHGNNVVVLTHGFRKTTVVPPQEIQRALERKAKFEMDPARHSGEIVL